MPQVTLICACYDQAQPIFKDPNRFPEMVDPLLHKKFPVRSLNQAVAIAAMCLQEEGTVRPLISDVVTALSFLSLPPQECTPSPLPIPTTLSQSEDIDLNEDEDHADNYKHGKDIREEYPQTYAKEEGSYSSHDNHMRSYSHYESFSSSQVSQRSEGWTFTQ